MPVVSAGTASITKSICTAVTVPVAAYMSSAGSNLWVHSDTISGPTCCQTADCPACFASYFQSYSLVGASLARYEKAEWNDLLRLLTEPIQTLSLSIDRSPKDNWT